MEICRDNEYPGVLHKVTLFYCINFGAVVPTSTVTRHFSRTSYRIEVGWFAGVRSKLNKIELACLDLEILGLRQFLCVVLQTVCSWTFKQTRFEFLL